MHFCGKNMLMVGIESAAELEALLMARTQRQTGNESQLSAQLLLLSNDAVVIGCTEVLFPKFLLVVFNMLSAEHEDVQRVVCGMVWENRARNLTRHSLSAHS